MLKVTGSREMIADLRKRSKKIRDQVTVTHQNLVKMMFRDLVAHTPQWSGELALHWGIEFHGYKAPPAYTVRNPAYDRIEKDVPYTEEPFRMGAEPAVTMTIARELQKVSQIRYNSIVTFTNRMPYAEDVEMGRTSTGRALRDVNRLGGYAGAAMIGYLKVKYSDKAMIRKAIPR